jgi:hypothetical protein
MVAIGRKCVSAPGLEGPERAFCRIAKNERVYGGNRIFKDVLRLRKFLQYRTRDPFS